MGGEVEERWAGDEPHEGGGEGSGSRHGVEDGGEGEGAICWGGGTPMGRGAPPG